MTTTTSAMINPAEQQEPNSDLPDTVPMGNAEAKAAWLAALRSGQFQQGRGQLFEPGSQTYCCLGVACEVYRMATDQGHWNPVGSFQAPDGLTHSGVLPLQVRDWFGLAESDPVVAGSHMTELNDSLGKTFEEIAELIEANL